MRKFLLLGAIVGAAFQAQSQGETDWWYFGQNAGMHFTPNPSAVNNGTISTSEGSASISDAAGNLLFYTDGITVKNANHATMTNGTGLLGNSSSTQSGQVVPKPGSNTEYYIFSIDDAVGPNGMTYSLVDMTASGGLGAVSTTVKNIFLQNGLVEKVATVPKSNGWWVCSLEAPGDTFVAYEVTSSGVNSVPVKSNTGINLSTSQFYGCMKANAQGTQLAAAHQGIPGAVHVFDFDNNTGEVTGTTTITTTVAGTQSTNTNYGVEFSASGDLLYVQSWLYGDIRQYDLTAGSAAAISSSVVALGSSTISGGGTMQLAKDGKMYAARNLQSVVSSVASPDVQGTGAGYTASAVTLSGGTGCRWGLPNFIQDYFGATMTIENFCLGDSTLFFADTNNTDSILWIFGDPNSGQANLDNGLQTGHIFSDTGVFNVTLVAYSGGLTDTIVEPIYIYSRQWADLGEDTTLCSNEMFLIDQNQPHATWEWHTGSTDSIYIVTYPDNMVMVTVYGVCDTVSDTLEVTYFTPFNLDLGPDFSICTYSDTILSTGLTSSIGQPLYFNWNVGANTSEIFVMNPGTYAVTVNDDECTYADTITITHFPEVDVDLGNDSSFCYVNSALLQPDGQNALSYAWSTGSTTNAISVGTSNEYFVTAYGIGGNCKATDSVQWDFYFNPQVDLGPDVQFCHDESYTIQAGFSAPHTFIWNNNTTENQLTTPLVGLYWVEVSDEHCSMRDTIILSHFPKLEVTLGQDIKTCDGKTETITPVATLPVTQYTWSTGETNSTIKVNDHGSYSVTVFDGYCDAEDQVNVFYFDVPIVDLGPDTSVCPGASLTFDVTRQADVTDYRWFDFTTEPIYTIAVRDSGTYWVDVTNVVCTTRDSITVYYRSVPNAFIGNDTSICIGSSLNLVHLPDSTIVSAMWSNGDQGPSTSVSDTGLHTVSLFDGTCTTRGKRVVSYKPQPTPDEVALELPATICIDEEFFVDMTHPHVSGYRWQDGSTQPTYTITGDGLYWFEASFACGSIRDTAVVDRCECPVWLPNSFNPDGDGVNDAFKPESECAFILYEFAIYDRWGSQVFYTETPGESWDGTVKGVEAPIGAYTWTLTFTANERGKEVERDASGSVLIVR